MDNTKFCIKCGKKIPESSEFCPYCGTSQVGNESPKQSQNSSTQLDQITSVSNNPHHGMFIGLGWLCAVISLFIPLTGIAALVLAIIDTVKNNHKAAGIVLIVFSILFFYFGMTGFGTGFMNGVNGR
ncbi:zinc-ribbon domain-containing protein [Secundilactobacillus silagei]|uniref:Integral membrane protein (Putative) n=1 Tax=Secundilactobacillus silagei JCM 19001 TaxID=1302250 RepID=A0A1Z5IJI5_9LACO|nr:zinc ribbon domain-containing protein [Secundilactobacillus silagei]TDG68631.1 hypothetical protein C5L25_001707 [Secundilactobacillus silagei JCM 19001]GAX01920.1 integral membrane protein (putative) [Secundilactobacillus silagei JCM 19001]